jgi:flotillin
METGLDWSWIWWGIPSLAILALIIVFIARRYVKAGPNEVLIVSGIKHRFRDATGQKITVGYRIVRGGGTFVIPVFERVDRLSMELFTLDVNTPEVYTQRGVPVFVDGIAQVKVRSDEKSIRIAAEQFLSKGRAEIMRIALQTLEGHLRAIIGALTVEEAYSNREMFATRVQEVAESDMAGMGLSIVSFTTRDIKDKQGYLEALGRPQIAEVKKNAEVGEANARRDMLILSAKAEQEGRTAQLAADTEIAAADRDYKMRVAEYEAAIQQKKAVADLAYDLEKYKLNQQVRAEELQVELVEKNKRIDIEEKEIERREKELVASVEKPAAAERYRIETLAEAEKNRREKIALGEAEAVRRRGEAEAEANKARGLAEAEVIKQQGSAEAAAMDKKAEAWQQYNEAAIVQMLAEKLPEIARAVSEPLAKTEKMIVINSDGASRVTQDIGNIIAQLPPIVESLTGLDFAKLLQRIPRMGGVTPPEEPAADSATQPADEPAVVKRGKITISRPGESQATKEEKQDKPRADGG